MATIKSTVLKISRQLNDQRRGYEYTRWIRDDVIGYCYDGLVQVALYRPDAFTSVFNVELQPGVRQKLPDGVSSLVSISNPLAVTRDDLGLVRAFGKKPCLYQLDEAGNVVYALTAYAYDPRTPGYFFVSPPVPSNMVPPATIDINCVIPPPEIDPTWWLKDMPVDRKYHNAVIAWALSRAYEVDTESENSFRLMNFQRGEFYKMMGVKYSMDSKYNSGWYLGQRGYEANVKGQQ